MVFLWFSLAFPSPFGFPFACAFFQFSFGRLSLEFFWFFFGFPLIIYWLSFALFTDKHGLQNGLAFNIAACFEARRKPTVREGWLWDAELRPFKSSGRKPKARQLNRGHCERSRVDHGTGLTQSRKLRAFYSGISGLRKQCETSSQLKNCEASHALRLPVMNPKLLFCNIPARPQRGL